MKNQLSPTELLKRGAIVASLVTLLVVYSFLFGMSSTLLYGCIALIVLLFGEQVLLFCVFKLFKVVYKMFGNNNAV